MKRPTYLDLRVPYDATFSHLVEWSMSIRIYLWSLGLFGVILQMMSIFEVENGHSKVSVYNCNGGMC